MGWNTFGIWASRICVLTRLKGKIWKLHTSQLLMTHWQHSKTQELQCFLTYFWTQEGWSGTILGHLTRVELVNQDLNDLYNCCVVVGLFYSVCSQLLTTASRSYSGFDFYLSIFGYLFTCVWSNIRAPACMTHTNQFLSWRNYPSRSTVWRPGVSSASLSFNSLPIYTFNTHMDC